MEGGQRERRQPSQRDEEPAGRLGFSDRSAGVCALWGVVTGVFVWSAVQALGLWSIAACAAMCLAAPVLFAVGRTKPAQPSAPEAALGRVLCIPAKLVFRVFGLSAEAAVTEEDLLSMVDDAEEDVIDEERKEMIANIVELDDVTAGDIMTHRTELVSVEDTATTARPCIWPRRRACRACRCTAAASTTWRASCT